MKLTIYIVINLFILYLSKQIILILTGKDQASSTYSNQGTKRPFHKDDVISWGLMLLLAILQSIIDRSLTSSAAPPNLMMQITYMLQFIFYLYISKRSPLWALSTLFIDLFISSGLFALSFKFNTWPQNLVLCLIALLGIAFINRLFKALKDDPLMESIRNIYDLLVIAFVCNMVLYTLIIISKKLYFTSPYFLYTAFQDYWVTFILLTLFFVISAILVESVKTHRFMLDQNALLKDYVTSLNHFERDIALYEKELNDHLQSIIKDLDHQDASHLEFPYFEDAFKNNQHALYYVKEINKVKDTGLKGILITKFYTATQKNIAFDISIENYRGKRFITPVDLSRMIGILLDNAIEACTECPQPYLKVSMFHDTDHYTIEIVNTYRQIKPNLESTKGQNRGIGRQSFMERLKDYPRISHSETITDHHFIQSIFIIEEDHAIDS